MRKEDRNTQQNSRIYTIGEPRIESNKTFSHSKSLRRRSGLGIQGLMKSFSAKKAFSGSWDEELEGIFCDFETISSICEVND